MVLRYKWTSLHFPNCLALHLIELNTLTFCEEDFRVFFGRKLGVVVVAAHTLSPLGWQSQSSPGFKLPPIDHRTATVMAPKERRRGGEEDD